MRRWAEFVLRHRRLIIVFWLLVIVVGGGLSKKVNDRLTIDFSLPGQPGTDTAQKIQDLVGNGGFTSPYVVTVTMPSGQKITGNEAAVAKTFNALDGSIKTQSLRIVDEANTNDKAFRTKDDRTAYAMVFFRFDHSPSQKLLTAPLKAAATAAAPQGATIGVTGEDVLASGDSSSGPGVLGETLLGAVGALAVLAFVFGSFLAFLPLIVAAASIMATFIMLLPITYATARVVHRRVPHRADRPRRGHRLLAAVRHAMARGTRPRRGKSRSRQDRDADGRARDRLQRCHRGHRFASAHRAARAVHAQHGLRRCAHPAGQRADDVDVHPGDPRRRSARASTGRRSGTRTAPAARGAVGPGWSSSAAGSPRASRSPSSRCSPAPCSARRSVRRPLPRSPTPARPTVAADTRSSGGVNNGTLTPIEILVDSNQAQRSRPTSPRSTASPGC